MVGRTVNIYGSTRDKVICQQMESRRQRALKENSGKEGIVEEKNVIDQGLMGSQNLLSTTLP